ncbi:MAG: ribonuclease III [Myxococcales bacterium]|nr:ribonuclease III [Myxococcales bacterium]
MSVSAEHEDLPVLEGYLGHTFSDRALLATALRHRSYVNERAPTQPDNERLEFLGDAVLQLAVTHLLMEGDGANLSEGTLSLLRSQMVSEAQLSRLAQQIELGRFLLLGRGEEQSGGRHKQSLLADAYEAVIGALYRDGGFGMVLRVARRLLLSEVQRVTESRTLDYKSALQELVQSHKRARPRYEVVSTDGPDHERVFVVAVVLDDEELGRGQGRSKREAEHQAAQAALSVLGDRPDTLGIH